MPGTLTLNPDEVEDAPKPLSLDADEVETAPAQANSAIDTTHPAGLVGAMPTVPQPQVDMQVPSIGRTMLDALAQNSAAPEVAPGISTIKDPSLVAHTLATVSGVPEVIQGAKDISAGNPEFGAMEGEYGGSSIPELRNATKNPALVEHGAAELLQGGTQAAMLAGGPAAAIEAPIETAVGLGAGYAGQRASEKATRALGGGPEAQVLAGTVGGLASGTAGAMGIGPATWAIADRVRPVPPEPWTYSDEQMLPSPIAEPEYMPPGSRPGPVDG